METKNKIADCQPLLTRKELRSGIILLHCGTCETATKHQTLDEFGKPCAPARFSPANVGPHKRQCLVCSSKQVFPKEVSS
jgi:hypothetical protein